MSVLLLFYYPSFSFFCGGEKSRVEIIALYSQTHILKIRSTQNKCLLAYGYPQTLLDRRNRVYLQHYVTNIEVRFPKKTKDDRSLLYLVDRLSLYMYSIYEEKKSKEKGE